jgi:hypothetical protein
MKDSMFHLQCIILSKACCVKNAEAAENSDIFQLVSDFQRSVTHSRVARATHQAVAIKAESLMCTCVQFQHSSWNCFGGSIDLQSLVKIKGVP